MGKEVELKIPVSKDNLTLALYKYGCNNQGTDFYLMSKNDEYYSKYSSIKEGKEHGEFLTRVRTVRCEKFFKIDTDLINAFFDEQTPFAKDGPETVYFTLKTKNSKDGIEDNYENECVYSSEQADQLKLLLKDAGYKVVFNKLKETLSFQDNSTKCNVDISRIFGTYYVEIEYTKDDTDNVISKIMKVCEMLNISPNDKDTRTWPEILEDIQAKQTVKNA